MTTTAIVTVLVGVFYALDRLGILERIGIVRPSASTAATELELSDRALERLRSELAAERSKAIELARTRSMEPIIEQLTKLQAEVLDRLVAHNGSFAHMEKSMSSIEESLKVLTGFIVSTAAPGARL